MIVGGVAAAIVVGVAVWWWVWPSNFPSAPIPPPDAPTGAPVPDSGQPQDPGLLQIQAVRTILTAVGGIGALFGLGVVMRRQWSQERDSRYQQADADRRHQLELENAARSEHDAAERRITELYMAAAEQLGHEKAPVRLAALYALDRLGQNHPELRQVIADIWCAYLRQPFIPPIRFITEDFEDRDSLSATDSTVDSYLTPRSGDYAAEEARELEYEVRATAQRLLQRHLTDPRSIRERTKEPPPGITNGYWQLDRIDLNGATLIELNLLKCWLPEVDFAHARFYSHAGFNSVCFSGYARFSGVKFYGRALFLDVTFNRGAWFGGAQFYGDALFHRSRVWKMAYFNETHFHGEARFNRTRFHARINFRGARVYDGAAFDFSDANAALFHEESQDQADNLPLGWTLVPFAEGGEGEVGWGRLEPSPTETE